MSNEGRYKLRQTLNEFHVLSGQEFEDFLSVCQFQSFKKKELILSEGKYNHGIYFVVSGAVGLFENIDGKEMYQNFFLPQEFANELKSLTSRMPSTKNLIAISDTTCFFLPRQELLKLYENSISIERLGRILLEHMLNKQNELSFVLQSLTQEERYEYLEMHNPRLLQAIPLTYLASYLGMARETLSRIRARK